jgi:hypothetical protein
MRTFQKDENLCLPPDLDYDKIHGLSNEERALLRVTKPESVGQARRIEGVCFAHPSPTPTSKPNLRPFGVIERLCLHSLLPFSLSSRADFMGVVVDDAFGMPSPFGTCEEGEEERGERGGI